MSDKETGSEAGLRDRLQRSGEEAVGKVVQDMLENPVFTGTLTRALEARERASQAQEAAMGALNLPSAADVARLTRRVRSVGQRLEGIEDALDRLESKLSSSGIGAVEDRLAEIEKSIAAVASRQTSPAKAAPAARKPAARKPAAKPAARKPAAKSRSTKS
jgi:hypothetical protein